MKNLFKFKRIVYVTYRNRKHALVLYIYPNDESSFAPIIIEFIPDENDSEEVKLQKLQAYVQACYDKQKKLYEDSANYSGHVKNGTYVRIIQYLFPEEGKTITIHIVMQRYKSKQTGTTRTFYGGMVVPRVSLLTCQAITVLADMAYCNEPCKKDNEEPLLLKDFRESWGISVKTYWTLLRKAHEWFEAFRLSKEILFEVEDLLLYIYYCAAPEKVFRKCPGFLC